MTTETPRLGEQIEGEPVDRGSRRKWSVIGIGVLLGALSIAGAFVGTTGFDTMRAAIPLAASLAIVAAGVRLLGTNLTGDDIGVVAAWTAATAALFVVVLLATAFVVANDPLIVGAFAALFTAPLGAAGGTVAGYSDARRRQQYRVTRRTQRALETSTDGIAILNDRGEYVTVNGSFAEMYGYDDPEAVVGEPWERFYSSSEAARIEAEVFPELRAHHEWRGEATGQRADGSTFPQELTLTRMKDGGSVAIVRDITESRARERRLRSIIENVPIVLFTFDEDGTITLSEGEGLEALGLEPGEAVGDSMFEMYAGFPNVIDGCRQALDGKTVHRTIDLGAVILEAWLTPVYENGEVTEVIGTAMDVTDEHEQRRRIETLHEASRRLTYATTAEEVAGTAVDIAEEVLDCPVSTMWRYDKSSESLVPFGVTDSSKELLEVESTADLDPITDDELGMEVFQQGESRTIENYQEVDNRAFDQPLGAMLLIPLGDIGLLEIGRQEAGEIPDMDLKQAEILGLNAQAALDRVEREEELETRTSQMEFINSILRHDVLNGMTVIRARAEILEGELEGDYGDYAETIRRWCDDITAFVERVQTVLNALGGQEGSISLEPVDVTRLLEGELDRIGQAYPEVEFDTSLPSDLQARADELLGDVLGNIVRNAIEHNDTEGLRIEASAERVDDRVRIRIADNGRGIPPEQYEAVFRRGETHAKSAGSGFGLFFVDAMVDAYGGDIRIEDNDPGAAFVVELDGPESADSQRGKPGGQL
ncbi:PAS domain S-box protein [Natronomonas amylolytica]|uniref:PAS domain S-box protein n=1 Tax=Natronomonas amylolytica TaxID=3108498 RepID=UPI003008C9CC